MQLLIPPHKNYEVNNTLIFLAGPIQGTYNWQNYFVENFEDYNISIANPRRTYLDGDFVYEKQVAWETKYLNLADIIVFWLSKEEEPILGRAYAQTTRFELGEWMGKQQFWQENKAIIIGADPEFSGKRYIKTRIEQDYKHLTLFNTFEEVILETKKVLKELETL